MRFKLKGIAAKSAAKAAMSEARRSTANCKRMSRARWQVVLLRAKGVAWVAVAMIWADWSIALAQPDKVVYELQERCGRRAAEVFAKEWGSHVVNNSAGQTTANFENHYSPRLNKCFYLEISTTYERGKKPFKALRLFDLHDNKEHATFVDGLICSVQGKDCLNEAEWRELVKPYMND